MAPSAAVTTTLIALLPTLRAMAPLGEPLDTVVPATVTVALELFTVGVTFAWVLELATVAV